MELSARRLRSPDSHREGEFAVRILVLAALAYAAYRALRPSDPLPHPVLAGPKGKRLHGSEHLSKRSAT